MVLSEAACEIALIAVTSLPITALGKGKLRVAPLGFKHTDCATSTVPLGSVLKPKVDSPMSVEFVVPNTEQPHALTQPGGRFGGSRGRKCGAHPPISGKGPDTN